MQATPEQTIAQLRMLLAYLRRMQREYDYIGIDLHNFIAKQEARLRRLQAQEKAL